MEAVEGDSKILFSNSSGINAYDPLTLSWNITCKNGDSYYAADNFLGLSDEAGYSAELTLPNYFFEPGFTYNFDISVKFNGDPYANLSESAKATKNGITLIVN